MAGFLPAAIGKRASAGAGAPPGRGTVDSGDYWRQRYATGGTSGPGSYGRLAEFKAEVLNEFVCAHSVRSVVEFGCGDGNQLKLANYPRYAGFDVSPEAVARCSTLFRHDPSKVFRLLDEYHGERADLALSLDVVFHLVEDAVFSSYMDRLFESAERFVIIYSSNRDEGGPPMAPHVRHRRFTDWVALHRPDWRQIQRIPNKYPWRGDDASGSFADFYIYGRPTT